LPYLTGRISELDVVFGKIRKKTLFCISANLNKNFGNPLKVLLDERIGLTKVAVFLGEIGLQQLYKPADPEGEPFLDCK
jgi:hypothetical protein